MDDHNYSRVGRWAQLVFRGAASAAAVLACAQPVLAGGFLQGHYSLLAAHRNAAMILAGAILLSLLAAVLVWRPGRGPGSLPALCGVTLLLCGGQIGLGFARVLIIHIPLGIAVLALVVWIAVIGWRTPLPGRSAPAASETAAPETAAPEAAVSEAAVAETAVYEAVGVEA
jgi:hypothetical protein